VGRPAPPVPVPRVRAGRQGGGAIPRGARASGILRGGRISASRRAGGGCFVSVGHPNLAAAAPPPGLLSTSGCGGDSGLLAHLPGVWIRCSRPRSTRCSGGGPGQRRAGVRFGGGGGRGRSSRCRGGGSPHARSRPAVGCGWLEARPRRSRSAGLWTRPAALAHGREVGGAA